MARSKNHILSSGTSLYCPNKGVVPRLELKIICDLQPRHRIGVAIGEHVLDLAEISELFTGPLMSQRKSVLEEVRSTVSS